MDNSSCVERLRECLATTEQQKREDVLAVWKELMLQCGCCARCALRFGWLHSGFTQLLPFTSQELSEAIFKLCNEQEGDSTANTNNILDNVCVLCFGLLGSVETIASDIVAAFKNSEHESTLFHLTVSLPVSMMLRQFSIWYHLKDKRGDYCKTEQPAVGKNVVDIKDMFKWLISPLCSPVLSVPKVPLLAKLVLTHEETFTEGLLASAQRLSNKKTKKKANMTSSHAAVSSILKSISASQFKERYHCPPSPIQNSCSWSVSFHCESVFVAGRYIKYSNSLSQSPWFIDGVRKTSSSVEEYIVNSIRPYFKADGKYQSAQISPHTTQDYKFSSSGREDVDVRMLGNGRPFALEFINPKIPNHSEEEFLEMQYLVNNSTKDIQICHLQSVSQKLLSVLKEGEEKKQKQYRCLVWVSRPVTKQELNKLEGIHDLEITQRTPIRVLHRRSLADRRRTIYSIKCEPQTDPQYFILYLTTQAGTYVKEFVHSDLGRTVPSIGSLLNSEADILQLDVMSILLDFPPPISAVEPLEYSFKYEDVISKAK